ncbi:MAG: GNAT family N-acetyltransferase [Paucibacter sp.]|nr:GNAT family N-acetyltransferase [Roseateles sp.]
MAGPIDVRLRWRCLPFEGLNVHELYAALALRAQVFVLEQDCVYLDLDGHDPAVLHLLGQAADSDAVLAYARLVPPGTKGPSQTQPMIGRVVTAPAARGRGAGRALMLQALRACAEHWPGQAVEIQAQSYLRAFYASLGFVATSAPYLDDDIEHIDMRREFKADFTVD